MCHTEGTEGLCSVNGWTTSGRGNGNRIPRRQEEGDEHRNVPLTVSANLPT